MKFIVVWFQRKDGLAYAQTDGGQLVWTSKLKRAARFDSEPAALRFMHQFTNYRSLLSVLEA